MPPSSPDRRRMLRESLILIAERRIAQAGLSALRARDLAAEAGCAVGAIYNVFGDLTDLVLAVNARTFDRLGAAVGDAVAQVPDEDRLIVMAKAYHHFAAANYNAWRALFDVERPAGTAAPDWYLAAMGQLLSLIDFPLAGRFPTLDEAERALMTRALFSAVHGIVLLGLDDASVGVPRDRIDRMIEFILRQIG